MEIRKETKKVIAFLTLIILLNSLSLASELTPDSIIKINIQNKLNTNSNSISLLQGLLTLNQNSNSLGAEKSWDGLIPSSFFQLSKQNLLTGFAAAQITSAKLNATTIYNLTTDNLTAYITSTDPDGDNITHIINWKKNGNSLTALNTPFDTNTTSLAKDYSGNQNNGTLIGDTSWTSNGYIGGAYLFDGNGDRIDFSGSSTNIPGSFTVSLRFKKLGPAGTWGGIISKNRINGCSGFDDAYLIYITNTGSIEARVGNTSTEFYLSGGVLSGGWHHAALVYDKEANSKYTFYIDGNYKSSSTRGSGWTSITSGKTMIADWCTVSPNFYFNGTVDEVRIWDTALTADQIKSLYNKNNTEIHSSMTDHWETWSYDVTPNDGADGTLAASNNLVIRPYSPILPTTNLYRQGSNSNLTVIAGRNADYDSILKLELFFPFSNASFVNYTYSLEAQDTNTSTYTSNGTTIILDWDIPAGDNDSITIVVENATEINYIRNMIFEDPNTGREYPIYLGNTLLREKIGAVIPRKQSYCNLRTKGRIITENETLPAYIEIVSW